MQIKLYYKYLKHDIDQKTWRASNARFDDPEKRAGAQSDSTDDDFYHRMVEAAVAKMLAPLGDMHLDTIKESDDILDLNKKAWTIVLSDDTNASARTVAELMHNYIVNYTMANWSALYSPEESVGFANAAVSDQQSLEELMFQITLPSKKHGHRCIVESYADDSFVMNNEVQILPIDN